MDANFAFARFCIRFRSMKFLAGILFIYVLALSASFCPDACSDENDGCQTEQHDCADCCSPFSFCNTCVGFLMTDIAHAQADPQELSAEIETCEPHIYADISLDGILQPPKFA